MGFLRWLQAALRGGGADQVTPFEGGRGDEVTPFDSSERRETELHSSHAIVTPGKSHLASVVPGRQNPGSGQRDAIVPVVSQESSAALEDIPDDIDVWEREVEMGRPSAISSGSHAVVSQGATPQRGVVQCISPPAGPVESTPAYKLNGDLMSTDSTKRMMASRVSSTGKESGEFLEESSTPTLSRSGESCRGGRI